MITYFTKRLLRLYTYTTQTDDCLIPEIETVLYLYWERERYRINSECWKLSLLKYNLKSGIKRRIMQGYNTNRKIKFKHLASRIIICFVYKNADICRRLYLKHNKSTGMKASWSNFAPLAQLNVHKSPSRRHSSAFVNSIYRLVNLGKTLKAFVILKQPYLNGFNATRRNRYRSYKTVLWINETVFLIISNHHHACIGIHDMEKMETQ